MLKSFKRPLAIAMATVMTLSMSLSAFAGTISISADGLDAASISATDGQKIKLTAPATNGTNTFSKWVWSETGDTASYDASFNVIADGDMALEAVYAAEAETATSGVGFYKNATVDNGTATYYMSLFGTIADAVALTMNGTAVSKPVADLTNAAASGVYQFKAEKVMDDAVNNYVLAGTASDQVAVADANVLSAENLLPDSTGAATSGSYVNYFLAPGTKLGNYTLTGSANTALVYNNFDSVVTGANTPLPATVEVNGTSHTFTQALGLNRAGSNQISFTTTEAGYLYVAASGHNVLTTRNITLAGPDGFEQTIAASTPACHTYTLTTPGTYTLTGSGGSATAYIDVYHIEFVADALLTEKADAIAEVEAYAADKGEANYTAEGWATIQSAVATATTAINAATTTDAMAAAVADAKNAIDAVAVAATYTVSATVTPEGSATVEFATTTVKEGTAATFTVSPATGYTVDTVKVGETALTAVDGVYSFVPTADTTVTVTLRTATTYTVTVNEMTNGSVAVVDANGAAVNSGSSVVEGTVITVTATADTGYQLDTLTVEGATENNDGTYTVNADTTISATFAEQSAIVFNPDTYDEAVNTEFKLVSGKIEKLSGISSKAVVNGDGTFSLASNTIANTDNNPATIPDVTVTNGYHLGGSTSGKGTLATNCLQFTAPSAGTVNVYAACIGTSNRRLRYEGSNVTANVNGFLAYTQEISAAGTYAIGANSSSVYLVYVEFTPAA